MPATRADIVAILTDSEFTRAEKQLLECQFPNVCQPSNFIEKLFALLYACDDGNLRKMEAAFPDHVAAVRCWSIGDLAQRIRAKGCDV